MTRRATQLDQLPLDPFIDSAHERRWVPKSLRVAGAPHGGGYARPCGPRPTFASRLDLRSPYLVRKVVHGDVPSADLKPGEVDQRGLAVPRRRELERTMLGNLRLEQDRVVTRESEPPAGDRDFNNPRASHEELQK